MMKHFPQLRACANLRYAQAYVEMARKNKFKVVFLTGEKSRPD
jgi:predicted fused transcriptional regulator/phosphomethylpyrimidine kinase